jgi:hypothetical protein
MGKLYSPSPHFSVDHPEGCDRISRDPSLLAVHRCCRLGLTLLRGSCFVPLEIRTYRGCGCKTSVDTVLEKTLVLPGFRPDQ